MVCIEVYDNVKMLLDLVKLRVNGKIHLVLNYA
jgi:hypothetical protein